MSSRSNPDLPTTAEIAALTARLRELSSAGAAADAAARARFLADKDALIARITAAARHANPPPRARAEAWAASAAEDALTEVVRARAADGGYALVGPSARAWRTDPDTGRPVEPVDEAEHGALRQLIGREEFTTEPAWHDGEIVSTVIPDVDDATGPADELGLTGAEGPPIDAGPALTANEAAHELAADGHSIDEARALVRGYLDDVSEQIGASAHLWGLDGADLDAIRAGERVHTTAAVERAHDAVTALPTTAEDEAVRHDETANEQTDVLVLEEP